ncbi:MAG TPA: hypothetical protein VMZ92_00735 [Planctomycetota bacterium]|nr:hypothetical protein [Planctomycetota bacterium]
MSEAVDRHLLALPRGGGRVYLSWRLLSEDAPDVGFAVEGRRPGEGWQPVGDAPVTDSTNFLDDTRGGEREYRVVADGTPSEVVRVDTSAPPTICAVDEPLDPEDKVALIAIGDLTNNGRMGYVLRVVRHGTVWFSARRHDGKLLWEMDTCIPAAGGWDRSSHHVPFLSWDVNGDGRTEVAFHRFEGDFPRDTYDEGVGEGELLTVVDGETGEVVWDAPWPARKPRVMMTVGHLRGRDRPAHIVVLDETYGPVDLTAVDGKTGKVTWRVRQERPAGHNLDVGDIDLDGMQEVICGGVCYNGDGTVRWQAELKGHTDISKPARIDPGREGLQVWYAVESTDPGVYLVDSRGRTIFKEAFRHAHYGWVARHTAKVPGLQPHTAEDSRRDTVEHNPIFLPDGTHWLNLTDWQRKNFVPVHWDEGPEVVFIIRKENKRVVRLLESGEMEDLPEGELPEGGRYGRNLVCADVMGDYRENIVTVDEERNRLMVLANPTLARRRGTSPFEDFEYRHDRSQHGSGYYIYLSPPVTTT